MPHSIAQPQTTSSSRSTGRVGLGRSRPPAPHQPRADADRPRRRALLEGVPEPDRARKDPADRRDGRVARLATRRRPLVPRDGSLLERPRPRRGHRLSRRGCNRGARVRRRGTDARRRFATPSTRTPQPVSSSALLLAESWARMYLGEIRAAVEMLGRARQLAEGPGFHRRRPGRGPLPARLLSLESFVDRDGRRALHRGARARRPLWLALRSSPLAHPRLAKPLSPAPARLGSRARGRRAGARARRGARTTRRRSPITTSRPR